MTKRILLSKIYFTQDSINYNFSDGTGNLRKMFEKIKNLKFFKMNRFYIE